MPASNFPGVALGSAALLADASALAAKTLTLYAIKALTVEHFGGSDTSCKGLFCTGTSCPQPGVDYFQLPPVTLTPDAANIVVVEGCAASVLLETSNTLGCGASYDPVNGNLRAEILAVVPSGTSGAGMAVQVAQLSQGLADALGEAGSASVSLAALNPDGGATTLVRSIATVSSQGEVLPQEPMALPVDGSLSSYGGLGIRLDLPGDEAGAREVFTTLAQALQLADPTADPSVYYGSPGTYVIAIVGDPNAPAPFATGPDAGFYNGTGLHFVIAPAQPAGDAAQ